MRLTSNEQTTPKFVGGSHQILTAPNYKCSAAERICAIVKPERQQPKQTASQRTAIHSLRRVNEIAMLADVLLAGGALGLTFYAPNPPSHPPRALPVYRVRQPSSCPVIARQAQSLKASKGLKQRNLRLYLPGPDIKLDTGMVPCTRPSVQCPQQSSGSLAAVRCWGPLSGSSHDSAALCLFCCLRILHYNSVPNVQTQPLGPRQHR
jgi:hypothetical protein